MKVTFSFKGSIFGQKEDLEFNFKEQTTVLEAFRLLIQEIPSLKPLIFEGENSLRSDILVMVNQTDVIAMGLLDSPLKEGQEITVLPLAHGGG
ncbi:MAG: hypothetical protein GF308_04425 [Candidatus Heimdallarchaeota archaeon]|nr:hypothetical protein [Candidatus Heimdallarchaeota archaeon]